MSILSAGHKTSKRIVLLIMLVLILSASRCTTPQILEETQIGKEAYKLTAEMLKFGPRPPASKGIERVRIWIRSQVEKKGYTIETQKFDASTPIGKIPMQNLSFVIPGIKPGNEILLVAHYDSKRYLGFDFLGANDSASAVCLLLALSVPIQQKKYPFDVRFLFVDGEEALVNWTNADSLYGSRYFVSNLTPGKYKAAFVLDMIGDKDLKLIDNLRSDPVWREKLKKILTDAGQLELIEKNAIDVEDDHIPFIEAGIPTLHIMDFSYPAWHTEHDNLDQISAKSLSIVGEIVLELLELTP